MNGFLPDGYKQPVSGGYYKLQDGKNKFRVLSKAIVGYQYWNQEGKPVRSPKPFHGTPEDIRLDKEGKPERIKHFWAFAVWNPDAAQVQVMEITQATIMSQMKALVEDETWGDPKGYDITITRSGSGLDTEYVVMPAPHSAKPIEAVEAISRKSVYLEALYEGGDPFAPTHKPEEGEAHPDDVPVIEG